MLGFDDFRDVLEFCGFLVAVCLTGLILVGIAAALFNPLVKIGCEKSAIQNEVEFRYGFWSGCSYKHPVTGAWMPKDNYLRTVSD